MSANTLSSHLLREASSTERTSLRAWCECGTFPEKTPASVHTSMQPLLGNLSIWCLKAKTLRTTAGFPKMGEAPGESSSVIQKVVFCPESRLQFLLHCLHVPHIIAIFSTGDQSVVFQRKMSRHNVLLHLSSHSDISLVWRVYRVFFSISVPPNLLTQETWPLQEFAFISESTLRHPSPSKASSSLLSAAYSTDCTTKQHSWKMKQWHSHQGKVKSLGTQASKINSSRPILCAEVFLQASNKSMTDIFILQIYPDPILSLSFTNHSTAAKSRSIPLASSDTRKDVSLYNDINLRPSQLMLTTHQRNMHGQLPQPSCGLPNHIFSPSIIHG